MRSADLEKILQGTFHKMARDCYEPATNRCKGSPKPLSSMEALLEGHFHHVPVLLGVTEDDGLGKSELEQILFRDVKSRADLEKLLEEEFGADSQFVLQHYWPSEETSEARAVHICLSLFSNDLWYFAGTYHMAHLMSSKNPVFLYCFAASKRSVHGSDISYWRGASKNKVSRMMSRYLGNFVRTGHPNGLTKLTNPEGHSKEDAATYAGEKENTELPKWKSLSEAPGEWMFLDTEPAMKKIDEPAVEWYDFLLCKYFSKRILQKDQYEGKDECDPSEQGTCKRVCTGEKRLKTS